MGEGELSILPPLTRICFSLPGIPARAKATIFDAVVFALYGEASSNDNKKDGAELQSQFAPGLEPYVEMTFSEKQAGN